MNHKSSGYCNIKQITLDTEASVDAEALDVVYAKNELNQALIEWHPTETSVDEVQKDQNVAKEDFL